MGRAQCLSYWKDEMHRQHREGELKVKMHIFTGNCGGISMLATVFPPRDISEKYLRDHSEQKGNGGNLAFLFSVCFFIP